MYCCVSLLRQVFCIVFVAHNLFSGFIFHVQSIIYSFEVFSLHRRQLTGPRVEMNLLDQRFNTSVKCPGHRLGYRFLKLREEPSRVNRVYSRKFVLVIPSNGSNFTTEAAKLSRLIWRDDHKISELDYHRFGTTPHCSD